MKLSRLRPRPGRCDRRRVRPSVCIAVATTLVVGVAAVSARPVPCRSAQYTVAGAPLGSGATASRTVEIGALVGLGDACSLVAPRKRRAGKSGVTQVRARWETCRGFTGRVRLRTKVTDECTRVVGRLTAKGYRRAFEATRTDCGDGAFETAPPPVPYVATAESLATHPLPAWFDDAKFGIMVHWGIFTIPAWAETVLDPGEWLCCGKLLEPPDYGREFFTHIPYVEWYSNTIRIDGSPAQAHHAATYGAGFAYESFRPEFEAAAAAWSADAWADLFQGSGARYVVLVTKHHDGFALWPTGVPHPSRPQWSMARDVVGELTSAVRRRCMRMGLYYSGGFDWSVRPGPVETALDAVTVIPQSAEYAAYADGQYRELIQRYRPAALWNDIGYPGGADAFRLFADYYNAVPDGVINDRFSLVAGTTHHDYVTPEFTVLTDISATKFETVRGMGRGFGYNRNETDADLETPDGLVRLLVDVVAKNGNLLLNVGPMADGTVPAAQVSRLRAIGTWLATNGEAIFKTRPWVRAEGVTSDGTPVRFTQSADGATTFAIVMGPLPAGAVTIEGIDVAPSEVRLLGRDGPLPAVLAGTTLHIEVPNPPAESPAYAFALRR